MPKHHPISEKCDKSFDHDTIVAVKRFSDDQLIQLAIKGDENAFQRLFNRYKKKILVICFDFSKGDYALAHDLCQETFITAFRDINKLRNTSCFLYWVSVIAKNKCISHKRKQGRLNKVLKDYEVISQTMKGDERDWGPAELDLVVDLIENMKNDELKETIRLFYIEGKSSLQISEALGITQTAVTTRLNRFRTRYRKLLVKRILKLRSSRP